MPIKKIVPKFVKLFVKRTIDFLTWDEWFVRSWSQEGEDMVLRRIFSEKKEGFYVDVGAHHPKRFSNTYLLYRLGWSGLNIDAMPGSMHAFNRWRPRDINLEIGVARTAGTLDYYVFNEPALNGFSVQLTEERARASNPYHVKKKISVNVLPLSGVMDTYVGQKEIDFLSVDVEGLDLEVLQSNDWTKYRPKFVLAEILKSSMHELEENPISRFMKECGYVFYAKQVNTVFFMDSLSR